MEKRTNCECAEKSCCSVVLCLLTYVGLVQAAGSRSLPFDPRQVVGRVRGRRSGPSADRRDVLTGGAATPLALDGEFLIDTSRVIGPAPGDQEYPAVSFDGTNFLVVWQDWRSDYRGIYGARVTLAGAVLDPVGISISTVVEDQSHPAISFDGTNYLVVWGDCRSGSYDMYGTRVSQAGTVLDPEGISISTAANHQWHPAVSFDGTDYLVVWQDLRSGDYDIYSARVAPGGAVLDPVGISISTVVEDQSHPAISSDGTNYLVVWQDLRSGDYDIYGARVSPAGTVLDDFPVVTQEGNQSPSAVARGPGDQMFLVYQSWAGTVEGKTYNAQRIWGKFVVLTGIEEGEQLTANGSRLTATVVRGVLNMGQRLTANGTQPDIGLFDTNGRKVADLKPGPNDIRHLAPGVYFISSASGVGRQASANSSFSGRHRHVRAVGFWNGGHWGC